MRIVIDTNVFISGSFWNGSSAKIIRMIEQGSHLLVLSDEILAEFHRVIFYKEIQDKVKNQERSLLAWQKIRALAIIVKPRSRVHAVTEDPDDNKFIEAAIEGNAAVIISQDHHLLKLVQYSGIRIMTPDVFLKEA